MHTFFSLRSLRSANTPARHATSLRRSFWRRARAHALITLTLAFALTITLATARAEDTSSFTDTSSSPDDDSPTSPALLSTTDLPIYQFLQTNALFYGAELEAIVHRHQYRSHTLDLRFTADTVRAQNHSADANLPRITPNRASVVWHLPVSTQPLEIFLRGNNLTNQEARNNVSFLKDIAPLPGRDITLGLRIAF